MLYVVDLWSILCDYKILIGYLKRIYTQITFCCLFTEQWTISNTYGVHHRVHHTLYIQCKYKLTGGDVKIKRAALNVFKFSVFLSSSSTSSVVVSCTDDCLDVKDRFNAPLEDDAFEVLLRKGQEAISREYLLHLNCIKFCPRFVSIGIN